MEEYINKIRRAFRRYLAEYLTQKRTIVIRGVTIEIEHLLDSHFEIDLGEIKLHELLSGNNTRINITGTMRVSQTIPDGKRNRTIEFWANSTTVLFNSETAEFELIDILELLYIDFNL